MDTKFLRRFMFEVAVLLLVSILFFATRGHAEGGAENAVAAPATVSGPLAWCAYQTKSLVVNGGISSRQQATGVVLLVLAFAYIMYNVGHYVGWCRAKIDMKLAIRKSVVEDTDANGYYRAPTKGG